MYSTREKFEKNMEDKLLKQKRKREIELKKKKNDKDKMSNL